MRKFLFIVLPVWLMATSVVAQQQVVLEKYDLLFESPETVYEYDTGEKNVFGVEGDNYAVDVEVITIQPESSTPKAYVASAADKLANDMRLKTIKKGNFTSKIETGYYVTAEDIDFDDSSYPVIVLVIINENQNTAFEITIDCYSKDLAKGIAIADSFQFTN